jgi:lysophospholipase L1-like esterase
MAMRNSFVAIGDSFTEGLDDPGGNGHFRGWADRVAGHLAADNPDFRYANLAIRGRLLGSVIDEQVPAAIEMAPDLVSFAAGGNDVLRRGYDPDRVHAKLDTVIGQLRATGAEVLLFTAADLTAVLPRALEPRVRSFNNVIQVVAATHGAILVDLWRDPGFRHVRMWSEDRLHLSSYGHARVASHVLEKLGVAYPPREDLPPVPRTPWLAARWSDVQWVRRHLAPWVHRRLTGRSSGDTVKPKRPELTPVDAD